MMKKIIVVIWLILLLFVVGSIFWYTDLVYQLPTPVPSNYKGTVSGQVIELGTPLKAMNDKPLFIHFFNPDCPCSRFNMATFKNLVKHYNGQVTFVIVVLSRKTYTVKEIQNKFDLNTPVFFNAAIATSCGVYSTPQVVLLNRQHKLYYRGNYNSSRYCTDERMNYAKIAITGLLNEQVHIAFNPLALRPYGCQLPNCSR
jgi:thiol-disulfide isomerase/thioredoxin